jgi:hypothetical protein
LTAQKAKRLVAIDVDAKVKEIAELNDVLRQRDAKLAEAQQAQADLIKKQRQLDDAKREMDLTIQKQVQAELGAVRDQAKQEAEAALTLRVREKEEQIASMQRQIEDLRRKAEQGSQQLQGEVQELALEGLLRQKFPRDVFEPAPKGEFGGDLIQRVVGPAGQICGSILWEAKRTKNWADGWLGKVREDQRAAKADMALIVSHALPKGLQTFDQIDGVWVTEPRSAGAVAIALRESLIALASARLAGEGQQTKMELVYKYLTGPRFRHRIEAVVERFSDMQADLDRERKDAAGGDNLVQSQIRMLGDQFEKPSRMRFQRRRAAAAWFGGGAPTAASTAPQNSRSPRTVPPPRAATRPPRRTPPTASAGPTNSPSTSIASKKPNQ